MTPKQERFVAEYLIDLNATQAAIRAGYSPRTAYAIGDENLRKPYIAAAIDQRRSALQAHIAIDAVKVLHTLDAIIEADIADIYDEKNNLRPIGEWPLVWRKMCVGMEPIFKHSSDGQNESWDQAGFKVKFERGNKALELLGRHVSVNAFVQPTEKHEHVHLHVTVEDRLSKARQIAAEKVND